MSNVNKDLILDGEHKTTICPFCAMDWDAGDVVDKLQKHNPNKPFSWVLQVAKSFGWSEEFKTRFSKLETVQYLNEDIQHYRCPTCQEYWDTDGKHLPGHTGITPFE